jgi:YGGT family
MQKHTEIVDTTPTRGPEQRTSTGTPVAIGSTASNTEWSAAGRAGSSRLVQAVYLVFGLVEALLLIRFVLRALGANAEAGFAQVIYGVTGVLIAPFVGLFGTAQVASGPAFELHTLIALLVYAAIGWLLARTAGLIVGDSGSTAVQRVRSEQSRVR